MSSAGSPGGKDVGYRVRLAEGALERSDYHAGSPQVRARDLMSMFADPGIHAIQCLRGGYGSAQVVPLLDFQAIARHPKPFIGFSHITALHTALLKFCGLVTFYGPSLTQAADMSSFTAERLLKVLAAKRPVSTRTALTTRTLLYRRR